MERWQGKIALVTGASSGIGAAIVQELLAAGVIVVAVARREAKLQELAELLPSGSEFHPLRCDVSSNEDIETVFQFIRDTFGTMHILVNNAAVVHLGRMLSAETNIEMLKETMDVNVMGAALCTRYAVQLMQESDVDDGHIININSIAGHGIPDRDDPIMNVYPVSKNALSILNEVIRFELVALKSKIRVSSISPGFTNTDFFSGQQLLSDEEIETFLGDRPSLNAADVANAVMFVLAAPRHVQITELTIKPTGEPV